MSAETKNGLNVPKMWHYSDKELLDFVSRKSDNAYRETEADQLLNDCLAMAAQRAPRYQNRVQAVIGRIKSEQSAVYHDLLWNVPRTASIRARKDLATLVAVREASLAGHFGAMVRKGLIEKSDLNAEGTINTRTLGFEFVAVTSSKTEDDKVSMQNRSRYFEQNPLALSVLAGYKVSERNLWRKQLIKEAELAKESQAAIEISLTPSRPLSIGDRFRILGQKTQTWTAGIKALANVPAATFFLHF